MLLTVLAITHDIAHALDVRPISFHTMRRTLVAWRDTHDVSTEDHKSTFEMIAWHATVLDRHGSLAMYDHDNIRAIAQLREVESTRYMVRCIATPADEEYAGSILLQHLLDAGIMVDWDAMPDRWWVAACYYVTR
jgi:hypothetical protein